VKEWTCNWFTKVGPGEWKKLADHVQAKVEDKFWDQNNICMRLLYVTESDSSEDESSEESVDMSASNDE